MKAFREREKEIKKSYNLYLKNQLELPYKDNEEKKTKDLYEWIKTSNFLYQDYKRLVDDFNYTELMLANKLKSLRCYGAHYVKIACWLMEDFKKEQ